jgi:hypothetical protein
VNCKKSIKRSNNKIVNNQGKKKKTNAGKDAGKRETLYTVGGNAK